MKPKPKPRELTVVKHKNIVISLIVYSNDAKAFISSEAPRYGAVYEEGANRFDLFVSPGFDFNEVAEYFESYND